LGAQKASCYEEVILGRDLKGKTVQRRAGAVKVGSGNPCPRRKTRGGHTGGKKKGEEGREGLFSVEKKGRMVIGVKELAIRVYFGKIGKKKERKVGCLGRYTDERILKWDLQYRSQEQKSSLKFGGGKKGGENQPWNLPLGKRCSTGLKNGRGEGSIIL